MTKRQLKQIMSLYKGGISYRAAVRIAVSISLPKPYLVTEAFIDKVTDAALDTMVEITKVDQEREVSNDNS